VPTAGRREPALELRNGRRPERANWIAPTHVVDDRRYFGENHGRDKDISANNDNSELRYAEDKQGAITGSSFGNKQQREKRGEDENDSEQENADNPGAMGFG
jgi:hypothetical protein